MTLGAFHLFPGVVDILRMMEFKAGEILFQGRRRFSRALSHDQMTGGALIRQAVAVGIAHFIVVAAKTAVVDEMA